MKISKMHERHLKNLLQALKDKSKDNDNYYTYMHFAYESCLLEKDKRALKAEAKPTFELNVLGSHINAQFKTLADSAPTIMIKSDTAPQEAEILTTVIQNIFHKSRLETQTYNAIKSSVVGGFGVYEVKTRYRNDSDFQQEIYVEVIDNPTSVYFDPNAKKRCKSDAKYVGKIKELSKVEFLDLFSKEKLKQVEEAARIGNKISDVTEDIEWVSGEKGNEKFKICEYFYYKTEKEYLCLHDDMTTEVVKRQEDIPEGCIKVRTIDVNRVMKKTFCGTIVLTKPEKSNFTKLPFAYITGDSFINKDGKTIPRSFLKDVLDAQRIKCLCANVFLFNLVNRTEGTWVYGIHSTPEDVVKDLLNNSSRRRAIGVLESYLDPDTGQAMPGMIPKYTGPEPLDEASMNAMTELNKEIEYILGSRNSGGKYQTGEYLKSLSDFISSVNEPFMQSLTEALEHVGCVILSTLPQIMLSDEIVMNEKGEDMSLSRDFNDKIHSVYSKRSVSTKLLRQESVKQLVELAAVSPTLAEFLGTAGTNYLLENLDLTKKEEFIKTFDNFMRQEQQSKAQQGNQPNPEQITAQAKLIRAQADMAKAQQSMQQTQVDAELSVRKIEQELQKLNVSQQQAVLSYLSSKEKAHVENLRTTAQMLHGN